MRKLLRTRGMRITQIINQAILLLSSIRITRSIIEEFRGLNMKELCTLDIQAFYLFLDVIKALFCQTFYKRSLLFKQSGHTYALQPRRSTAVATNRTKETFLQVRSLPPLCNNYWTIDCTFYRFNGVISHAECWEKTRKVYKP